MVSLNETKLTGNVTADPELKQIGDGEDSVVVEGIIIHNWRLNEDAKEPEKKVILPFKIYGSQARRFAQTVTTKNNILLSGRLETETWMQGDQNRSRSFLLVRAWQYNSARSEPAADSAASASKAKARKPVTTS